MQGVDVVRTDTLCHTLIFSEAVLAALFLDNFKMPNLKPYDRKGDPIAYVEVFRA